MDLELDKVRKIILTDEIIQDALDASIRRDPARVANIIFPIIGPSIRKSVVDYFERLMFAFNRAIEHTFSYQGMIWRIEALKSGRPFSEVVLLHSILFRVEDIFVIHKKSGILLIQCSAVSAKKRSGDQVAGMLTAIHDFVGEAFSRDNIIQNLNSVRVGETNLLMEQSSDLLLAAAIRGEATDAFRNMLLKQLENFQDQYSKQLATFNGNVDVFAGATEAFQECLVQEQKKPSHEISQRMQNVRKITKSVIIFLLFALLVWWIVALAYNIENKRELTQYVSKLEKNEGIVFLGSEEVANNSWVIRILKTNQFFVRTPELPEGLTGKVKVLSKPFASFYPSPSDPLGEVRIPYNRDSKMIIEDIQEELFLFTAIVKKLIHGTANNNFHIRAYVFDNPGNLRVRILLSRLIGRLEDALAHAGITNNKIIKYSILNPSGMIKAPVMRFAVIYD
jgi:hypothetical protein